MNEYNTEKYIEQYEHISKLELLTSAELSQVKRKRAQFEVSVKNASDPKPFIEYIKFELALIKKFQQLEYQNENDERALERSLAKNVKDIFFLSLRKFQDRRTLWALYLAFAKSKFPHSVTGIYQQMLNFHSTKEDYIEAIEYEMSKSNFNVALGFLIQVMNREKESKELVALHIRCSLQQADEQGDEKFKENTIQQVSKFYAKFLQDSEDVLLHIGLIQSIQNFTFALGFQNDVLSNLIKKFTGQPATWDLLAKRHLDGLFFGDKHDDDGDDEAKEAPEEIPLETRLRRALAIYDKSFEIIGESSVKQMYEFYITKLLQLDDESTSMSDSCQRQLRHALGKALTQGYGDDKLSEVHFIFLLKLRILQKEQHRKQIDEMFDKGMRLYSKSMEFYELAIKYFIADKNYDKIAKIFKHAISVNEKNAIELYKFLCEIYLTNPSDKDKAKCAMMEAINSNDKKLSASFQPYVIEYYAHTDGIEKAREMFASLLKSKAVTSLSLDFFNAMIKVEQQQEKPDNKIIANCFERGVDGFGKEDAEVRYWRAHVGRRLICKLKFSAFRSGSSISSTFGSKANSTKQVACESAPSR
jgi:tetratricopeptide (TPR) repeat protein